MVKRASDDELILAAGQGDEAAYAQLMQRHWDWVCRLMGSFVQDPHQAEDLAQEAIYEARFMIQ